MAENPVLSFFPIVCGTCGKRLSRVARAYEQFQRDPSNKMTFQEFCESTGISNYCCRMNILCQPVIVTSAYVPKLPEREVEEPIVSESGQFEPARVTPLLTPEQVKERIGNIPEEGLTEEAVIRAASYLRPQEIAGYLKEARRFAREAGHPPGVEPGVIIHPELLRSLNRLNFQSRQFTSVPAALSILEAKRIGTLAAVQPAAAPSPKIAAKLPPPPGSLLVRAISKPAGLPPPPPLQPLVPMKPAAKPSGLPPPVQLPPVPMAKQAGLPPQPLKPAGKPTGKLSGVPPTSIRTFALKPSAKPSALPGSK